MASRTLVEDLMEASETIEVHIDPGQRSWIKLPDKKRSIPVLRSKEVQQQPKLVFKQEEARDTIIEKRITVLPSLPERSTSFKSCKTVSEKTPKPKTETSSKPKVPLASIWFKKVLNSKFLSDQPPKKYSLERTASSKSRIVYIEAIRQGETTSFMTKPLANFRERKVSSNNSGYLYTRPQSRIVPKANLFQVKNHEVSKENSSVFFKKEIPGDKHNQSTRPYVFKTKQISATSIPAPSDAILAELPLDGLAGIKKVDVSLFPQESKTTAYRSRGTGAINSILFKLYSSGRSGQGVSKS